MEGKKGKKLQKSGKRSRTRKAIRKRWGKREAREREKEMEGQDKRDGIRKTGQEEKNLNLLATLNN